MSGNDYYINLNGTFNCCRAVLPSMIEQAGRIASLPVAGKEGNPNAAAYSARAG